jgi:hypothetical protein
VEQYVEVLKLRAIILHNEVQEDHFIPLKNTQEEIEDPGREINPTSKRHKIIK